MRLFRNLDCRLTADCHFQNRASRVHFHHHQHSQEQGKSMEKQLKDFRARLERGRYHFMHILWIIVVTWIHLFTRQSVEYSVAEQTCAATMEKEEIRMSWIDSTLCHTFIYNGLNTCNCCMPILPIHCNLSIYIYIFLKNCLSEWNI